MLHITLIIFVKVLCILKSSWVLNIHGYLIKLKSLLLLFLVSPCTKQTTSLLSPRHRYLIEGVIALDIVGPAPVFFQAVLKELFDIEWPYNPLDHGGWVPSSRRVCALPHTIIGG